MSDEATEAEVNDEVEAQEVQEEETTTEVDDSEVTEAEQDKLDIEHVKKLRSEAKNLRARLKAAEERAALADKYEEERMTAEERQEKERERVAGEIQSLRRERNHLKIQSEFPLIDDDLLDLLPETDDYEVLAVKAKTLSDKLSAGAPKREAEQKRKQVVDPDELSDGKNKRGVENPSEVADTFYNR